MDNVFGRYRNLTVLGVVLLAQVLGLAVQVQRPTDAGSARLIRFWVVSTVTPIQKALVSTTGFAKDTWREYFALREVREENRKLREEIDRLRIEQVRLGEDARQAHRLQALLGFREQFVAQTLPAQVIGTTGTDRSRGLYIDKGSSDGVAVDMAVITADGIVGKVHSVFPSTALVMQITDESSGVGALLENSRLHGIVKGTASGEVVLDYVMADQTVQPGDRVLTSGGGTVFPKGLPVGTASRVYADGLFLKIIVAPAAQLNRLEEVLVITRIEQRAPEADVAGPPMRAADILSGRLPSVPPKPEPQAIKPAGVAGTGAAPPVRSGTAAQAAPTTTQTRPATAQPKPAPAGGATPSKPAPPSGTPPPKPESAAPTKSDGQPTPGAPR